MGQVVSSPKVSRLFPAAFSLASPERAASLSRDPAPAAESSASDPDSVSLQGQTPEAGSFEAVTYHTQMERVSLAATLRQVRERLSETQAGGTQAATAESQQLTFQFFGEVRTEDLVLFRQRTDGVTQSLGGAQRETYIEVSRKVAARFQLSLTISGEALTGFTRASENLKDGSSSLFDKFLGFGKDVLSNPDDVVNEILKLLDGFFRGNGDFETAFEKFRTAVFGAGAQPGDGMADASSASFQLYPYRYSELNIQMEFSFEYSESVQVGEAAVQESDPIALDLNGNGIDLSNYRNGARFDITGKNETATTAFVTGGDAFLAIDQNGNGIIDTGKELFGDQNGARNGYEELAKLDSNKDGLINKFDKDFDKLLLFKDNGNGRTERGELVSLAEAGIAELSLDYQNVNMTASGGNRIAQIASYRRTDGATGRTADAVLHFTA